MDDIVLRSKELCKRHANEERPYEFKYEAAEILRKALEKNSIHIDKYLGAVLNARRGLALLETDLLADGQHLLEGSLPTLEDKKQDNLSLLIESYNALGALQSNRSDLDTAVTWLTKAEGLYLQHRSAGRQVDRPDPLNVSASGMEGAAAQDHFVEETPSMSPLNSQLLSPLPIFSPSDAGDWDEAEAQHTSTLFYLAQVHAHAQNRVLSAHYCAATLQRQLESGQYQLQEWIQNCLQLASIYVARREFAVGQYCLLAADKVVERDGSSTHSESRSSCTSETGQSISLGSEVSSENVSAEVANISKSIRLKLLGADVAANMELAWAKLSLHRLVASYDLLTKNGELSQANAFSSTKTLPDNLRFKTLSLPALDSLLWGMSALALTFEQARDIFNAGMLRYKAALEHYQLDGFVTEYCDIVMEISNMYRCLIGFEADVHRKCLMQRQRASRLKELHGVLNPEYYLGMVRSIALELGNINRDLAELEEQDGKKSKNVAVVARNDAVKYYEDFLNSFRDQDGGFPSGRFQDETNERYILQASFSLGRVLSRAPIRNTASLCKASEKLKWASDYVQEHGISEMGREAEMAREMAALLAEKVELTRRGVVL
ncbi:hypothetical protein CEUSTIGMA_g1953.t1 [Chlamydomonas eustigma]|uniref:KIF-binding protein n=1 Tax=Chlamydomonas eustigma TaxID=1157962 RepID=A0A250WUJ5_9CHLO|nr:hypothetical protein CEUSTIGMA_g1953.t1 [Chlamydomonas eustigma]|eukprot:GAX74504.1 hypothetical protein CEUSTIGMA_g1953.t1 [Chlamydomonas eustigma]